jgi:hypothetical protein
MDSALIAEQFAGITDYVGGAFGDFVFAGQGAVVAATLKGPCTALQPDDPRLAGSSDRLFALTVPTPTVPAGLTAGHELTNRGRIRRIQRLDDVPNGLTEIVLTA